VVKKEIDVSIIQKLKDNKIGFFPYVADASLRGKLRSDLQALQVPEWNNKNYLNLLPRVVSEIWRSYLEKTIPQVLNAERVQKLELQLELENIKQSLIGGIFTPSEESDFSYIWEIMNRNQEVVFYQIDSKAEEVTERFTHQVNIRTILPFLATPSGYEYSSSSIDAILLKQRPNALSSVEVLIKESPDIANELLMFGMLERRELPRLSNSSGSGRTTAYLFQDPTVRSLAYTAKLNRFNYWLTFKGLMPERIEWQQEN